MHDRENVIKALHCRAQGFEIFACDECEYQIQIANRRGCDYMQICRDALSLLNEQQKLIDDITQRRINNGEFD